MLASCSFFLLKIRKTRNYYRCNRFGFVGRGLAGCKFCICLKLKRKSFPSVHLIKATRRGCSNSHNGSFDQIVASETRSSLGCSWYFSLVIQNRRIGAFSFAFLEAQRIILMFILGVINLRTNIFFGFSCVINVCLLFCL